MSVDRSVTIRLRVSAAEFDAAMARAGISVEALAAEVRAAGDEAGAGGKKIDELGNASKRAGSKLGALGTTALALGPALVPAAAAGAAAVAGLGATAGVAGLAFAGLRDEWKAGTLQSSELGGQITTLHAGLKGLEQTAAHGVAPGLATGLEDINSLMPQANADVATLSSQLGVIAGNTGAGVVSLLHDFNPLISDLGDDLEVGSAKFAQWAQSSDSVRQFVSFVRGELPEVEHLLGELAVSGSHIVQAYAPLGVSTVRILDGLAAGFNAIPVDVLKVAVPLISALVLSTKALKVAEKAQVWIKGLAVSEQALADSSAAAAGTSGVGALVPKLGSLTKQLGAAAGAYLVLKGSAAAAANEIGPGGSLARHIDDQTATIKVMAAAFDVSFDTIKKGVTGTDQDFKKMLDNLRKGPDGDKVKNFAIILGDLHDVLRNTDTSSAAATRAMRQQELATGKLSDANQKLITDVMSTTGQLGFLATALDRLSNNAIDAEQQELHLKDALGTTADNFKAAREQVHQHGRSLSEDTAAGRANREWLLTQISAVNDHAVAVGRQTGSVKKATAALGADERQLRQAAGAAGFNKKQINEMINRYEATPKRVRTSVELQTAHALNDLKNFEAKLAFLKRAIDVDVYLNLVTPGGFTPYQSRPHGHAAGGLIPGTGSGDIVPGMLMPGEFVVTKAAVRQVGVPYLEQLNSLGGTVNPIKTTTPAYASALPAPAPAGPAAMTTLTRPTGS